MTSIIKKEKSNSGGTTPVRVPPPKRQKGIGNPKKGGTSVKVKEKRYIIYPVPKNNPNHMKIFFLVGFKNFKNFL